MLLVAANIPTRPKPGKAGAALLRVVHRTGEFEFEKRILPFRKRDSSADSGKGYSKAATPDGTLDASMRSFEFEQNSFSLTRGDSKSSLFLDNLRKDI